jgi:hypothetical protein
MHNFSSKKRLERDEYVNEIHVVERKRNVESKWLNFDPRQDIFADPFLTSRHPTEGITTTRADEKSTQNIEQKHERHDCEIVWPLEMRWLPQTPRWS